MPLVEMLGWSEFRKQARASAAVTPQARHLPLLEIAGDHPCRLVSQPMAARFSLSHETRRDA
jgi:hypothetical protein